ncbi:PHD-finger family protein [Histomonas meleagridis]|uniref:PHD-finger family protein n=1 Tax=Histomonas meleagridis TaxID=135588 RepID=UPI003559FBAE|nr:PHD-finger family protein [Histomonas meleagridis]KAH0802400.1 PHD-finger family protein [Histomonas meleagridis]
MSIDATHQSSENEPVANLSDAEVLSMHSTSGLSISSLINDSKLSSSNTKQTNAIAKQPINLLNNFINNPTASSNDEQNKETNPIVRRKIIQQPIVRRRVVQPVVEEKPKPTKSVNIMPLPSIPIQSNFTPQLAPPEPYIQSQPILRPFSPTFYQPNFAFNNTYYPQQIYPVYPQYVPIPQQHVTIPKPMIQQNSFPQPFVIPLNSDEMFVPDAYPIIKDGKQIYLRCVCDEHHLEGLLIQCKKCKNYLHAMCVNEYKQRTAYNCPYCSKKKIRCKCNRNTLYNEPLIQCTRCKMWVHKSCEKLDFGANPKNFSCWSCGQNTYEIPYVTFDEKDVSVPNGYVTVDFDRTELINSIPNGYFSQLVTEEIGKSQIHFRLTLEKYFHIFASLLFDQAHEFWKVFNNTFCKLLNCERQVLLNAIDILATKLIYNENLSNETDPNNDSFTYTESIEKLLNSTQIPRIEKEPNQVEIYKGEDGHIHSSVQVEDGTLICLLPGVLMHTDEVQCEDGIPLSCLVVTDSSVVIDTSNTSFSFTPYFRRSFHFNCIVRLIRVNDEISVGLFATRMKGPLNEEKSRRGFAIQKDSEIILPFDGDIPYPLPKCEWKEKRRKVKTIIEIKDDPEYKTSMQTRSSTKKKNKSDDNLMINISRKHELASNMTLLGTFVNDSVPVIPFILLPDDESVQKFKEKQEKGKLRGKKISKYTSILA